MYKNIKKILENFEHKEISHEISCSCEDSKKFREEAGLSWIWSKNIVFHCKWNFYLVTTTWEKQIKARFFKKDFWSKDIRFATQDEITNLWLWKIWSISPFGFDNSEIPVFVDEEIFEHDFFMFNPADPEKTIQIKTEDLRKIYESLENSVKFFEYKIEEGLC